MLNRTAMMAAVAATLLTGPAGAGEWVLGAGIDDIFDQGDDDQTAGFGIEYRTEPLLTYGPLGLAAGIAGEVDLDGDLWGGAGPVLMLVQDKWRIGASGMPGAYEEGDGNDLGGTFAIRGQIFVDRAISDQARLGLALGHKSNAGTGDENPGVETLFATFSWLF